MTFLVTSDIDGTTTSVTLNADGRASSDANPGILLTPTERSGLFTAHVGHEQIPVVIETDGITSVTVSFRGFTHVATVLEERHAALMAILAASPAARSRNVRIAAPMPGLLKSTVVRDGDVVRKGEMLFTLEAMKMENVISAPIAGTVHITDIAVGTAVEKGTLLCTIEPNPA